MALPAHSHWRQSQEHCSPGSIVTRTAAAEDGGAVASLCEVFVHACTSAAGTCVRQNGLRPVALKSPALCEKTPKTLRGHPLKPQTRPFNSEAHGLTMSYLPDIPPKFEALP